ncbi:hypothetical protein [Lysobacter sp. N42]|jgi:hypothetical protein|uniref:hypothetical protein n=1 Tax=Lysobacter sp. N42 TaxID=2545719 RepID=UPI00104BEE41|nr:hypothetical protein [Lysobacter sp. N42]TCZ88333.1 hypothetical protein EYQ95_13830 [Lysobacter sp. N42]
MIFRAYARGDGALLLVPDCLVASRDAERRHGPLLFIGRIDDRHLADQAVWNRVLADIDRQSYAVVRGSMRSLLTSGTTETA